MGHSRPGPAGRRSSHVRYAPKATFGHQNAIGRDGPLTDIARHIRNVSPAVSLVLLSWLKALGTENRPRNWSSEELDQ